MDALTLIADTFAPLAGKRLLDIGCGPGHLVRALAARGALPTGLDPAADGLDLHRGEAQNLPFGDASFDGAIFLNSLHHVPGTSLDEALREAGRVVGPGRHVIVVEPLAEGSFFAALRVVEDETEVRAAAQAAIGRAIASGEFTLAVQHDFVRRDVFPNIDGFLQRVLAADAERAASIETNKDAIIAAFEAAAGRHDNGGYILEQPIRAHVLKVG